MIDRGAPSCVWAIVSLTCIVCGAVSAGTADKPVFQAGEDGSYTFDTGLLRGTLCAGGKSSGLTSVVHIPTGTRLDKGSGIFGYYRLLATDKRFGRMGWDLPGTSRLLDDGAVEITLPAAEDRPFELIAVYRWHDRATLDLDTKIKPTSDLSNFEIFLSSYFSEALPDPYVHVSGGRGRPGYLLVEKAYGDWLMFPRDEAALSLIHDGRWKKEPYPVAWTVMPGLVGCTAYRRGADSTPAVVIMAPHEDCFAVATPYQGESHYSLYLSLFGRDIKAGQSPEARARFVVTASHSHDDIAELWGRYSMLNIIRLIDDTDPARSRD